MVRFGLIANRSRNDSSTKENGHASPSMLSQLIKAQRKHSTFMEPFDPYQQWLGIPEQMRPLNHYILLGIRLFERDPSQINQAYDERMTVLKSFQSGQRVELSDQLISQVALAKRELTDSKKKKAYDENLKKQLLKLQNKQIALREAESDAQQSPVDSPAKFSPALAVGPATIRQDNSDKSDAAIEQNAIGQQVDAEFKNDSFADIEESGDDSLLGYLTDVRVWVAVLTIAFVMMTVTIKLLSSDSDEIGKLNPNGSVVQDSDNEAINKANSDEKSGEADSTAGMVEPSYSKVVQAANATFEIPLQKATLKGKDLKYGANGISGWGQADEAIWTLVPSDRRNGFFKCKIIYRAKFECRFSVQLGARPPRGFTIYPHDEDFEEEFIVKLDKSQAQTLRVIAGELDYSPEVEIKRIRLMPAR